jgi:hypothetical protein
MIMMMIMTMMMIITIIIYFSVGANGGIHEYAASSSDRALYLSLGMTSAAPPRS